MVDNWREFVGASSEGTFSLLENLISHENAGRILARMLTLEERKRRMCLTVLWARSTSSESWELYAREISQFSNPIESAL